MENRNGHNFKRRERILIRGFHIDPKNDRGVFWMLLDGEQVEEFQSLAEVEACLRHVVETLEKKYKTKINLGVSWEIDYPNNHKTTQKTLEQCSPSYREKKRAWLEGIKKKKKK